MRRPPDKWCVTDPAGKTWSILSDSSIHMERWTDTGYERTSDAAYRVEMVTPKLTYAELPKLQECVRRLRYAGQRPTVPVASTSMWMPPTITARA